MGEQSGARLGGDRYQHLYSWYEVLLLLPENSPYAYAYVEHPDAGAADDVTLHPHADSGGAARFVQVKYHVDHRETYSFASFTTAPSGRKPLLDKLYKSWKKLSPVVSAEIWLISNWTVDIDLGQHIRGSDWSLVEDFHQSEPPSIPGVARREWMNLLGITEEELARFCRSLRLRLAYGGIEDLHERVDDRMGRLGLRMGTEARASAMDEVRLWIEAGGENKRITRETLLEAIERRGLRAQSPTQPKVSLWVHGWERKQYDQPPTVEIDWTASFDRAERRIPPLDAWPAMLAQLDEARGQFLKEPEGRYIDFRGKASLTVGLAVGTKFPEVGGFSFRAEQPTHTEIFLWHSTASASGAAFEVKYEAGTVPGDDLLVFLAVSGDARADAQGFFESSGRKFAKLVYAEPAGGTGGAAVRGDADAVALAESAKTLIRTQRQGARAKRTHLIVFGPLTFCLFLGQRLNALGTIITYERTEEGGYQPSVTLKTG